MMTIQEMLDRKAELGYSNAVLAEKSGVPLSTVQKVLGGFTHAPRKKTLRALETALLREKAAEEASMLRESYENALPELTASPKKSRKSVDYRRAELIDGQVFPLPAPSPLHQEIIVRLRRTPSSLQPQFHCIHLDPSTVSFWFPVSCTQRS